MTAKDEAHYVIYRNLCDSMGYSAAYARATAIVSDLAEVKLTVRRGAR